MKFEDLFDGTLVTWNIQPVDPEKKEQKKVYLILYPVLRVHDTKFTKYLENPVKLGLIGRENECKLRYPSLVQRETKIVINIS